jgi:hypothetical protein
MSAAIGQRSMNLQTGGGLIALEIPPTISAGGRRWVGSGTGTDASSAFV